jgi:hypothetical protein
LIAHTIKKDLLKSSKDQPLDLKAEADKAKTKIIMNLNLPIEIKITNHLISKRLKIDQIRIQVTISKLLLAKIYNRLILVKQGTEQMILLKIH